MQIKNWSHVHSLRHQVAPTYQVGTTVDNATTAGQSATTGKSSGTGAQQNVYTGGQAGLQGNLGGLWQNFLSTLGSAAGGQIPSSYTNNPNLVGAFNTAYNQSVAPQEAFQGGAGSPAIASNQAIGLQQLLANQYNTGISQYQSALGLQNSGLGAGSNYALGLPTGSNTQATGQNTSNTNFSGQSTQDLMSLLLTNGGTI